MATIHLPRRSGPEGPVSRMVREGFWVLALGLVACYAFFVALGAFAPGDVVGVTVAAAALTALLVLHSVGDRRRGDRDPRITHARERRGF
jgi:peptidoglycan/LPS O-acetylase OafA/YrhL